MMSSWSRVFLLTVLLLVMISMTFGQNNAANNNEGSRPIFPPTPLPIRPTGNAKLDRLTRAAEALMRSNRRLIPLFVRLSFHDCVGRNGCDGCVDTTNPKNAGLDDTIEVVKSFRALNAPELSVADCMAFLGITAMKRAAINAGGRLEMDFLKGRKDCDPDRMPKNDIPQGHDLNTISILQSEFKLTTKEAVALIGAHSLGRSNRNNSAFDGLWDATEFALDLGYYQNMVSRGWFFQPVSNGNISSSQWSKTPNFMMLHSDVIILRQFTVSGDFHVPNCFFAFCPDAPTAPLVRELANDFLEFHKQIATAFVKMVDKSKEALIPF